MSDENNAPPPLPPPPPPPFISRTINGKVVWFAQNQEFGDFLAPGCITVHFLSVRQRKFTD
jgi:hypothetical protein